MLPYKKISHRLLHPEKAFQQVRFSSKNVPFFIGWIAIFLWLYSNAFPSDTFYLPNTFALLSSKNTPVFFCLWLSASLLLAFFVEARLFIPRTFYSVLGTLLCSIGIHFLKPGMLSLFLFMLAAIFVGHMFATFTYSFFMILNNSEKFYSMILAVFLPKLCIYGKLLLSHWNHPFLSPYLVGIVLLFVLLICSYSIRNTRTTIPETLNDKVPKSAYSLFPLIFVVLTLNDIFAPSALLQLNNLSSGNIERIYFYGILFGILSVFFLQRTFSIHLCHMLNISFALLAVGFVSHILSIHNSDSLFLSIFCFGISYSISFVNIYYLTGFMIKKFNNLSFYKTGVLLSSLYYFVSFLFLELTKGNQWLASSSFLSFFSICIILLYFIFYPFFAKTLYSGEWIDDTYRIDVTNCSRLENKLKNFKFTPSEVEVTKLLLEGYTLRQIASIQGKAYATINTYYVSIYRKLGIQSRSELLLLLKEYIVSK